MESRWTQTKKQRITNVDPMLLQTITKTTQALQKRLKFFHPRELAVVASSTGLLGFAPSTVRLYSKEIRVFAQNAPPLAFTSAHQLDSALVSVGEGDYNHVGRSKGRFDHVRCGIMAYLPNLRPHLHRSGQLSRQLKTLSPPNSALPITRYVLGLLLPFLIHDGHWDRALFAVCLFDHYVRVSEFLSLQVADYQTIAQRSTNPQEAWGVFVLKHAPEQGKRLKTRRNANVYVRSPELHNLLWKHRASCLARRQVRLFPFSYHQFMRSLQTFGKWLGISGKFTSHSFRHGGAEEADALGVAPATIQQRGRWASVRNMSIYLDNAAQAVLLLDREVPVARQHQGNRIFERRYDYLARCSSSLS